MSQLSRVVDGVISRSADYGPDLLVPSGAVAEIEIESLIENDAKNGYTVLVRGGGVLSLRLTSQGQRELRRRSRADWDGLRRNAVLSVISAWANARGAAFRRGLEWHAEKQGLPYSEIRAGCFVNPGRVEPPLRAEYEQGLARRRDTFNAQRVRSGGRNPCASGR